MSLVDIRNSLVALIEAIDPASDPDRRFYHIPPGAKLESLAGNPHRAFELRLVDNVDDKLAGFPRNRFRASFQLRIRYAKEKDELQAQVRASDDTVLIENALISPRTFPDGVDTVIPSFRFVFNGTYATATISVIYRRDPNV